MKFVFTAQEVRQIVIAAAVLSVAFALAYSNGIFGIKLAAFPYLVLFSFIAVGIGFLCHELIGHKLIAQRNGLHAEFRMWPVGLALALLSSLAGFVFAAPGAVYVSPRIDMWGQPAAVNKRRMGIVSIAGPLVNIVLAAVFFALNMISPRESLTSSH